LIVAFRSPSRHTWSHYMSSQVPSQQDSMMPSRCTASSRVRWQWCDEHNQ
jgi:hypothetical protein